VTLGRLQNGLAGLLARSAAERLRRRYPEWAEAMLNEQASLVGEQGQLDWAIGALRASLVLSARDLFYPAGLALAVGAVGLYQWRSDEGLVTVLVLSGLGLLLGFLRPSRFVVSGLVLGAVVATVNVFETLSGIRPVYEIHSHSLTHDVFWLVLVLPTLASSTLGRQAGLKLIV